MNNIQILDTKTINKIAAGEVVESPKAIIKELVENSIDAKSTSITVEISEGGINSIRIIDNGIGISKNDLQNAFLPHATSKLTKIEDLESIFSLGFRGEALASIAAVAQVEMTTKTETDEVGNTIEIHGGEIKNISEVATTTGTTMSVKNIFYNVVARRKFLKKPSTESGHISDLMNRFALGYPNISFKYINNGSSMFYTTGNNDLKTSIFQVYGKAVAKEMLPISFERDNLKINGMIGKPQLSKNNRNYENLFINGRFIKNTTVNTAVEDAYKTRLMVGKFPVFILNLTVEPSFVDVNVHPAKMEVRFKDDKLIYDFFYDAVIKVFENAMLIPKVELVKESENTTTNIPVKHIQETLDIDKLYKKNENKNEEETQKNINMSSNIDTILEDKKKITDQEKQEALDYLLGKTVNTETNQIQNQTNPIDLQDNVNNNYPTLLKQNQAEFYSFEKNRKPSVFEKTSSVNLFPSKKEELQEQEVTRNTFFTDYRIIGQIFKTYWIIEQNKSIYMIDQHACHEKIIYENLMNNFKSKKVLAQRVAYPIMLDLDPIEITTLDENIQLLNDFGFEVERFTDGEYALLSVPYYLDKISDISFFIEILNELGSKQVSSIYDMKIDAVATTACKAAVKGNTYMSEMEVKNLIQRLLKLENPFSCPHGRPIIIEMTKNEIEKMFKRIT